MILMRLRTVLIGFGKVGAAFAEDPVMAKYYPYASHAQVLRDHPCFQWEAVVDPSQEALKSASEGWHVPITKGSLEEILTRENIDVAIFATPPDSRLSFIDKLPRVRAILVEKPIARTLEESMAFLQKCKERNILVQVNFWRRADETFRKLADGWLEELIGIPQIVFGIYGNGLLNNGSHMIDFVRMLLGDIEAVQSFGTDSAYPAGPIRGDKNIHFNLYMKKSAVVTMHAVRFEHYRENGLDIWGQRGRLSIMLEGLCIYLFAKDNNRAMEGEWEVSFDKPQPILSTVGYAFYHVYSNLADAVNKGDSLWSSGESALKTFYVIQAILDSVRAGGAVVKIQW